MQFRRAILERDFAASDYAFVATLLAAAALLIAGLIVPAFTNDRLAQPEESLSIPSGALALGAAGKTGFMLVILTFSILFPALKLVALAAVWLLRFAVSTEDRTMRWLEVSPAPGATDGETG